MNRFFFYSAAVAALAATVIMPLLSCGGSSVPPADMVLMGGKIATVDESFSFAEAVAVRGDRFVKVGSDRDIKPYIGPDTHVIELKGKLVVPGLIDAHAHISGYGKSLSILDFRGVKSFEELIEMTAEKAKTLTHGEWIRGRSWDQNLWRGKEFPDHDALSKAVPGHPVWLTRVDGHAGIANKKALDIAGITAKTKDLDGGEILRKPNGEPSGVFIDRAMGLVSRHIPSSSPERNREAIIKAAESCLSVGLTGVHDAGAPPATIEHYKYLIDNGKLGIRVYAMLSNPGKDDVTEYLKANMVGNYGNHFLKVNSIKLFSDGALGSRGAALFEPYSDRPGYSGLLTISYERVFNISLNALDVGCQVCTHAIGDHANRLVLDAYEAALKERPAPDHRFRVEHAQVVALDDIPRFSSLGVIPSMQPTHATSDMYWAEDRLGSERVRGAYAWQRFLKTGSIIPCGSDFPVEENNPMLGIYAGITRRDPGGWPEDGWFPDQCMSREQVLRGFTTWAAYAAFQEDILGSIEEGKLADMVVLSKDILTIPPEDILTTVPEYTIVGGNIRYKR